MVARAVEVKETKRMKFTIAKQIGEQHFTFEDEAANDLEFFQKASFISSLPKSCEVCGSNEIVPRFQQTKEGYKYAKVVCLACHKELQFGQFAKGDGSLFRKQWVSPPTEAQRAASEKDERHGSRDLGF